MADFEELFTKREECESGKDKMVGTNEQRPVGVQAASAITRKIGESAS